MRTNLFERGDFESTLISQSQYNEYLLSVRSLNVKTASSSKPTVFLSHKHDDLNDARGIIGLLEEHGAKVYIDSIDNKMPGETSGNTAVRIKEMIEYCDKFILIATNNAIESYWCNWELGYGDNSKYIDHIAILPMKEKGDPNSRYLGNEYLQIYPKLHYNKPRYTIGRDFIKEGYHVSIPTRTEGVFQIIELKDWLSRKT